MDGMVPYLTPRITLHWLPSFIAASTPSFWLSNGVFPGPVSFEPAYRITPSTLGQFWASVEAMSRNPSHSAEIASVLPTLDLLAKWVEQSHGHGAFIRGINAPEPPEPPAVGQRIVEWLDRAANSEEHSSLDYDVWRERMGGKQILPSDDEFVNDHDLAV